MSDDSSELPKGWSKGAIDDMAQTATGGTPSRKRAQYYGGAIPWVKSGDLNDGIITGTSESITDEGLNNSNTKLFPRGAVCVALYGATVGKLGILDIDAATNQAVCGIFPEGGIESKFIFYSLRNERENLISQAQGGAQPNISNGIVKKTVLRVPPLAEQRRIVARIEELQERSRKAREVLAEVRPLLEQFRQSLLAAAFRGDITADWRAAHPNVEPAAELLSGIRQGRRRHWEEAEFAKYEERGQTPPKDWQDKYEESEPVDDSELARLPESWCWVHLEELVDVQLGQRRAPEFSKLEEYPYIRAGNITWKGLDLSEVKSMGFASPDSLLLEDGDILLNEASGSPREVGKPAIWRGEVSNCCFQATVLRLRSREITFRPEWLYFNRLFDALVGAYMAKTPGIGIIHLTAKLMRRWPIPFAPVEEQDEVIKRLKSALKMVDSWDESIAESVSDLDQLDHSILAKAFRGELVPQDPNDEPASVLLERIRQQRNSHSPKNNGKPYRRAKSQEA